MKKILFISSRNIINTCGELRLIKNRAQVLYQQYDISTDFFVYTHKKETKPETIKAGGNLAIYRVGMFNIIQRKIVFHKLKQDIRKKLLEVQYDYVIISGAAILGCIEAVKEVTGNIPVLADCHGAYEELLEFPGSNFGKTIARHMLYRIVKKSERKYLPEFDNIMAVSEGLKRYLVHEYHLYHDKIYVIPCAIEHQVMDLEKLRCIRTQARQRYGIQDGEQLFIYSGGTSKWQCIEESVQIFQNICAGNTVCKRRLLLLSGNLNEIIKYKSSNIIIDALSPGDVMNILPAGDFAFLLRDDYITNKVAYPNKLLDYVSAGLKVITTPFIEDVATEVKKRNLGYVLKYVQYESGLGEYCDSQFGVFGSDFNERQKLIDDVCFEKRMAFFADL